LGVEAARAGRARAKARRGKVLMSMEA
jgi:hypothetical protein